MQQSRSFKTRKKGSAWAKHGRHSVLPAHLHPGKKVKHKAEMYGSVREAFEAAKKDG